MTDYLSELRRLVHEEGVDPEAAADSVLRSISVDELRRVARPLLVWQAKNAQRAETRSIEREVAAAPVGESREMARKRLAQSGFWVPSKGRVEWLLATADDHHERASWLRGQAHGLIETARLHEQAAADITQAGVKCLADLQDKGAA